MSRTVRFNDAFVTRPWFTMDWPVGLRWAGCVAYIVLVTWLSLAPAATFTRLPSLLRWPGADKLVHFFMYGTLVLLLRWALAGHAQFRLPPWVVIAAAATYGLLLDVGQSLLVRYERSFQVGDLVANAMGAVFFWWLAGHLSARRAKCTTDSNCRSCGPATANEGDHDG